MYTFDVHVFTDVEYVFAKLTKVDRKIYQRLLGLYDPFNPSQIYMISPVEKESKTIFFEPVFQRFRSISVHNLDNKEINCNEYFFQGEGLMCSEHILNCGLSDTPKTHCYHCTITLLSKDRDSPKLNSN